MSLFGRCPAAYKCVESRNTPPVTAAIFKAKTLSAPLREKPPLLLPGTNSGRCCCLKTFDFGVGMEPGSPEEELGALPSRNISRSPATEQELIERAQRGDVTFRGR